MKDDVRVEISLVDLPFNRELISQTAGLQLMMRMFCAGIEKSDLELIWSLRTSKGGADFVRMGKRRSRFKTIFGTIDVPRIRIKYKESGKSATPSSRIWKLPRQVYLSRGLKNSICNTVVKETFASTRKQIETISGEVGLVSKSTIGNILHQVIFRTAA